MNRTSELYRLVPQWAVCNLVLLYIVYLNNLTHNTALELLATGKPITYEHYHVLATNGINIIVSLLCSYLADRIADVMIRKNYAEALERFRRASFVNQREQFPALESKIVTTSGTVAQFTHMIPNMVTSVIQLVAAVALVAQTHEAPKTLAGLAIVNLVAMVCAVRYISSKLSAGNAETAKLAHAEFGKKSTKMSYLNYRSMHGADSGSADEIANIVYRAECMFSRNTERNDHIRNACVMILDALATASIGLVPVTLPVWKLLGRYVDFAGTCSRSWIHYHSLKTRMLEVEEYFKKFDKSERFQVPQIDNPSEVRMQALQFARKSSEGRVVYTLTLTRELVFGKGEPRLILIEGVNGAGKSTFFDILAGGIEPATTVNGTTELITTMTINGLPVSHGWMHLLKSRLYLTQFSKEDIAASTWADFVAPVSVGSHPITDSMIIDAIHEVGLGPVFDSRAEGKLTAKIGILSGGEHRRLSLARTIVAMRSSPGTMLTIIDEADAGVDEITKGPESISEIINNIHSWYRGTIMAALHNKRFIRGLNWNAKLTFEKSIDPKTKAIHTMVTYSQKRKMK